jgi:tetratricopeptide (TPR) repeat protein
MWSGYTTREAAEFVGMSESMIRSCVRSGLLSPDGTHVPTRFSFRDLKVLKLVQSLASQGMSLRRVRRQLADLQRRLGPEASLAELSLAAEGGEVVVQDSSGGQRRAWCAESGQMLLAFGGPTAVAAGRGSDITAIPVVREAPGPEPVIGLNADAWLDKALDLEESDPAAAIVAYRRALKLRPDCTETLINLGRLYAEGGDPDHAEECFQEALELDPSDATALYNLGVVAQDTGRDEEAIELYRRALDLEPGLSEAHYNLATIYDRGGDPRAAIRHINEYRKLTRDR